MLTWIGLIIRGLGLNESSEHILCFVEAVLIQGVMFRSGTVEPDISAFDQDTTTAEDINLGFIYIVIECMVRSP